MNRIAGRRKAEAIGERDKLFTPTQLRTLIFPLIIEQILSISVGMADTMMISYAGEAAMSGVSLVDMINTLLINIFAAIATGGAVILSQYIGRREKENACQSASQLVMITVLISVGITGVVLLFQSPLLSLLYGTVAPDVMENALVYLEISAYSYPFLAVFNACAAIFRSFGNSKISMLVSVGMNLCNVAGNAVLIFGFEMGAAGAAWASFGSRALAAVVMLVLVKNRHLPVFVDWRLVFCWKGALIRRILFIAIPSGVENGIFQLGRVLVVSIISNFGTEQIAANAVANSLDSMGIIAGQAINLAMITVVGRCMGAGDARQAQYYTHKLLKIASGSIFLTNVVLLSCLHPILGLYSLSQESYQLAVLLIWIHNGLAPFLWPFSFTLPNALRAAGDVRFTMVVSIFSMFTFRILLSVILGIQLGWGALGVWIAMVVDWLFRILMFVIRFHRGKWKTIQVS